MSGLLIKDFRLLKHQGGLFGFVLILACGMAFVGSKNFSSFITSYLTFMVSMFSFSSFSYDDYDNGMAFLIALPSGRKDYVKAKYLFSILLITGGWLTGSLLRMIFFLLRFSAAEYLEVVAGEPVYLLLCLSYVGGTLPALIKFGAEKGRMIAFTVLAVIGTGGFLLVKTEVGFSLLKTIIGLAEMSLPLTMVFLAAVCALILSVSYLISLRIMEMREF